MTLCPDCGGAPSTKIVGNVECYTHAIGDACEGCGRVWDNCGFFRADGTYKEGWRSPRADEALRHIGGHDD